MPVSYSLSHRERGQGLWHIKKRQPEQIIFNQINEKKPPRQFIQHGDCFSGSLNITQMVAIQD
ncbi:hypothetical protein [Alysiella filiformis]|uniref:hypothetical protein n=1 Tax=Alysiella filiformis TaxID=194196 RepID=UPI0011778BC3|nr:hypothetical protein [Alysiella filiformis]QMT30735.1 hypothetical protein H3L97_08285 [Alysiella filiformis]UBQ56285.1 hypothetical protein JF568_00400 [Alysiella filiformis DSM 16848]